MTVRAYDRMITTIRPDLLREFAAYVAASGLAFGVDLGLLIVQVSLLDVPYLLAAAIAFSAGTVFLYWAATHRIFLFRRIRDPRTEFGIFVIVGLVGMAVNLAVLYVAVSRFELHYVLGKISAGAVTLGFNFCLRRLLLFSHWRQPLPARDPDEIRT
jgi:putative flippase GtrA